MPAQSVNPRIDEQREHEAVEGAAHHDPGEEGKDELDSAHRAAEELTARTYPVGGPGSRCGSDQRAVMASSVAAAGRDSYSVDWAMPAVGTLRGEVPLMARTTQRNVMRELHRCFNGDHDQVVAAYAEAERRGDVTRASNVRDMEPEEYARRLYADGVAKGWIA